MTKELRVSPLFWVGLLVKVVLLFFFGSPFLRDLFIPFIDFAVENVGANPWSHYPPKYFPYGSVLFALLFIPKLIGHLIFGPLVLGQGALSLFFMKMPLLVLDFGLLVTLLHLSRKSFKSIILYYWLNPATLYISYIHGQLDVASMSFVVLSLFLLLSGRYALSAVPMALAALCKFHVVVIFPFVLAYIWKREFRQEAIRSILRWGLICMGIVAVGFLPLLLSNRLGYATVSSPQAGLVYTMQWQLREGTAFLFGFGFLMLIVGRLCISTRISGRGLMFGCGIIFGVLLLITQPMPGWFFWVMPFLCLFYATYYNNHSILFWALNGTYLIYFGGLEFVPGFGGSFIGSASYTLMQAFLVACLAELWFLVIRPELPFIGTFRPRFFGISGDSGVGKNTLSYALAGVFGQSDSLVLEGDDYHRWERSHAKWDFYTHLNPRANKLPTLSQHTRELMLGRFVSQPHYDHETGQFTEPRDLKPTKTIFVQGLHTFYLKGMRDQFDLKIFMNPDENVSLAWKIKRDVIERGYPKEKVLESVKKRKKDSKQHINPQKEYADLVIEVFPAEKFTTKDILKGKEPKLSVRYTFWNDISISLLLDLLQDMGECETKVEEMPDNIDRVVLRIDGRPTAQQIEKVAAVLFPNIRYLTRSRTKPQWSSGLSGLHQLVVLLMVQNQVSLVHAQNY